MINGTKVAEKLILHARSDRKSVKVDPIPPLSAPRPHPPPPLPGLRLAHFIFPFEKQNMCIYLYVSLYFIF